MHDDHRLDVAGHLAEQLARMASLSWAGHPLYDSDEGHFVVAAVAEHLATKLRTVDRAAA